MRVAIAALKGGSGKTTTAVYLAMAASAEGPTLAVDADPQGSLTRWTEAALASPGGLNASAPQRIYDTLVAVTPTRMLDTLRRVAGEYRHVVID